MLREEQRRATNVICGIAEWVVIVIATCIISFLAILVFLFHFNAENSCPIKANVVLQVVCLGAVLGICWLAGHFLNARPKLCRWITVVGLGATLVFVGALSVSYVSQTLLLPNSDAKSCFDIALRFYQSEFGAVVPEGSYLSLWPYQTGLIFIMEKLMRVFNCTNPLLFQYIDCFYVLLMIVSGYGMVCMFTKRIEGRVLYLLLMSTYWQVIFSVSEVYGNIPGLAWTMFSCVSFMYYFRAKKKWQGIVALLGFSGAAILACTYKGNCLIYIVAIVLCTLVMQLHRVRGVLVGVVAVTTLLAVCSTSITQKYYEYWAGNVCGEGIPAVAWIAMGLQYNGEEAIPGGWNGFHSDTFIREGYDYDRTAEISKASIKESLQGFQENPGFAMHFFYNKTLKQWANQTYGYYWGANSAYDTTRDTEDFWVIFLERKQYEGLLPFFDIHESLIYGILFLACCSLVYRKIKGGKIPFQYLVPFVVFIGGFLFSLIWEGQTGAVMRYPVILLPVALGCLFEWRGCGGESTDVPLENAGM